MLPRALAVLSLLPVALSGGGSCGSNAIPFRFEVSPDGQPVLGCAIPQCFGFGHGDGQPQFTESVFLREGDEARGYLRYKDASSERARCPYNSDSNTCAASLDWVGGFEYDGNDLRLQCCRYDNLKYSAEVGRPVVHPGEVYSGGEVIRDGRQTGFDLISNVKKITGEDGSIAFELTVARLNCLPDPPEDLVEVELNQQEEIGRILDKVVSEDSELGVTPSTFSSSTPSAALSGRSFVPEEQQSFTAVDNQIGDEITAGQQEAVPQLSPEAGLQTLPQEGAQYPQQAQSVSQYAQPSQYSQYSQPSYGDYQPPVQQQYAQVGEQITPVITPGYYYPVTRCDWCASVPACFTAEMEVETREGPKRMDELEIGDEVVTVVEGTTMFTRVVGWQHKLPEQEAVFLRVHTNHREHIELTPLHFVWKVDCSLPHYNQNLTHAKNVVKGDCFYTLNSRKDGVNMQRVVRIEEFTQQGAFSPLTQTGDLVVNNIYVSCHNLYESNTASHTVLSASMKLESFLSQFIPSSIRSLFSSESMTHLPLATEFLLSVADSLVPFKGV